MNNKIQKSFYAAVFIGLAVVSFLKDAFAAQPEKYVFDNGMTVLITKVPTSPVVTLQAYVKCGSATEGKYLGTGVSHFIEHMLFKGTAKRPVGEIAKEVKSLGGIINASTSFDYTFYTVELPQGSFYQALDILSDMLMNPRFDEEDVQKEREVILGEIRMREDDPDSYLSQLIFNNVYTRHPYRHPIIGYTPLLKSLTRENLIDYYQSFYIPNNIIFSVAGNINEGEALEKIKIAFGDFKGRPYPLRNLPDEPAQLSFREYKENYPVELSRASLSFQGVAATDDDLFAMDVLAMLLGQGGSSRLYLDVYKKKELVHSISAMNFTPLDRGVFEVSCLLDKEKLDAALKAIKENIEAVKKRGVTSDELAKAKRQVLSQYILQHQTSADIAADAAFNEAYMGDLNFSKKYVERVRALTPADIQKVANKYLIETASTLVVLEPKAEGEAKSEAVHEAEAALIKKYTLENGITVLLREDHTFPLVSIRLALLGGLRSEPEGKNGLFNLLAGLWNRGTTSRTSEQISKITEERGMGVGGFSGQNSFGLNADCLSEDADFALSLIEDFVKNPTFPEIELAKAKISAKSAIIDRDDDIFAVTSKTLKENLFVNHPYGKDVLGTPESIDVISREDIVARYKEFCLPNNMVVSVFGDFDSEKMLAAVKNKFFALKKGELPLKTFEVTPISQTLQKDVAMDKKQAVVVVGFQGAKFSDNDRYTFEVLSSLLGSPLNSRIFNKIRDELGRAYTLGSRFTPGIDTGVISFYVSTTPEHVEKVKEILLSQIEELQKEYVTDNELKDTQTYLKGTQQMGLEVNASLASVCTFDELYGLGFETYAKYAEKIDSVTKEDIMRVAKAYLGKEKAVVVVTAGVKPEQAAKTTP